MTYFCLLSLNTVSGVKQHHITHSNEACMTSLSSCQCGHEASTLYHSLSWYTRVYHERLWYNL